MDLLKENKEQAGSKLDQLIAKLCPDGVEYKKLGEIGTDFYRGSGITREQIQSSGTPCVRYGEIYTTYGVWFDKCVSFADASKISNVKFIEYGDVIFAITGEKVEDIAKSTVYLGEEKCLVGGDIVVMKHKQYPKYMGYALSTTAAQLQKSQGKVKSKVVHSNVPSIKEISIPVPPLPVQQEIVRILDTFAELEAELEAELGAELEERKKQYSYFRDSLLNFDRKGNPFPCMSIGDFANFTYGYTERAKDKGTARFIRITDITDSGCLSPDNVKFIDICDENKKYLLKKGDILMARTGATYGRTLYISDDFPAIYASFLIKISPHNNKMLNRFYWHFAQSSVYWKQANNLVSKGGQPQFNSNVLCKVMVPVPPLSEQQRIVDILDKFDALCNDLTSDLSAEIAARRKQYEYYRDKLLTFKEKSHG